MNCLYELKMLACIVFMICSAVHIQTSLGQPFLAMRPTDRIIGIPVSSANTAQAWIPFSRMPHVLPSSLHSNPAAYFTVPSAAKTYPLDPSGHLPVMNWPESLSLRSPAASFHPPRMPSSLPSIRHRLPSVRKPPLEHYSRDHRKRPPSSMERPDYPARLRTELSLNPHKFRHQYPPKEMPHYRRRPQSERASSAENGFDYLPDEWHHKPREYKPPPKLPKRVDPYKKDLNMYSESTSRKEPTPWKQEPYYSERDEDYYYGRRRADSYTSAMKKPEHYTPSYRTKEIRRHEERHSVDRPRKKSDPFFDTQRLHPATVTRESSRYDHHTKPKPINSYTSRGQKSLMRSAEDSDSLEDNSYEMELNRKFPMSASKNGKVIKHPAPQNDLYDTSDNSDEQYFKLHDKYRNSFQKVPKTTSTTAFIKRYRDQIPYKQKVNPAMSKQSEQRISNTFKDIKIYDTAMPKNDSQDLDKSSSYEDLPTSQEVSANDKSSANNFATTAMSEPEEEYYTTQISSLGDQYATEAAEAISAYDENDNEDDATEQEVNEEITKTKADIKKVSVKDH